MPAVYFCKRCHIPVPALTDARGKEKVRGFPSGYVARFLACKHTISVNDKPVQSAQPESEAA